MNTSGPGAASSSAPIGAIVGGVVGALALALGVGVGYLLWRKRRMGSAPLGDGGAVARPWVESYPRFPK